MLRTTDSHIPRSKVWSNDLRDEHCPVDTMVPYNDFRVQDLLIKKLKKSKWLAFIISFKREGWTLNKRTILKLLNITLITDISVNKHNHHLMHQGSSNDFSMWDFFWLCMTSQKKVCTGAHYDRATKTERVVQTWFSSWGNQVYLWLPRLPSDYYHFIPGFTISMFSLQVWLYFAMFTMCFPFFGYLNY